MPSLWITSKGEVLEVPRGQSHEDMAGDLGTTQGDALEAGWIRVTGGLKSGWDMQVRDIERAKTVEVIEDFLFGVGSGAKEVRIESAKPKLVYLVVRGEDGETFSEAVSTALRRALEHPQMKGNPRRRFRR